MLKLDRKVGRKRMETRFRALFSTLFAVLFIGMMPSKADAQNFSFGVDLPLVGVVDNNNSQLAVGVGMNVGLVHAGPIRIGIGFGVVGYPGRPNIVEEVRDMSDLIFTTSTGFRLLRSGPGIPAVYFTVSYMKAATAKTIPGARKVNNGLLMGLTLSSR